MSQEPTQVNLYFSMNPCIPVSHSAPVDDIFTYVSYNFATSKRTKLLKLSSANDSETPNRSPAVEKNKHEPIYTMSLSADIPELWGKDSD